jgi:hypothetical protein
LNELRPIKVYSRLDAYGYTFIDAFGISSNDGQIEKNHSPYTNNENDLPHNIRKIDMFFRLDQRDFHSMVFYGDSTLQIG